MKNWMITGLLFVSGAAFGQTVSGSLTEFSQSRPEPADWTIAVYLDGDNDLEKFSLIDLNEMEMGIGGRVNVVVLVDRAQGYDTSDGDWTDARVYLVSADSDKSRIASEVIAAPGEINMGDPAVLEQFLATTIRNFPAKRTALVLWNHGGGWAVHAMDHGIPGEKHGTDHLTLPELSTSLGRALGDAGLERLDIIGFDMCLMAQFEVAAELAPYGEVLVASQATEPGDGWPYDRLLPAFADAGNDSREIASKIVDAFDGYYRERQEKITTLSAFDLDRFDEFSNRLDAVLAKLDGSLPSIWPDISRSIFFAEGYAARSDLQRSEQALASIDLLDALRRMEQNTAGFPASQELRSLEAALDRMVISAKNSALRRRSNGVAIYAPVTQAVVNEAYQELAVHGRSRWQGFLERLHGLQSAQDKPPIIRDLALVDYKTEQPITEARPLNTHGVYYVVEGTNLLWLNGMKGQWDEEKQGVYVFHRGSIVDANWSVRAKEAATDRLDLLIPRFTDGVNELITDTPGYRYAVTDGKDAFFATVDESGESGDYITVPILYHHPEAGDIGGTIYFDPQWWYAAAVELELVQEDGNIVYRQIKPEAQHEVTLLFEYLMANGELSYARGARIAWNDGPELLLTLDDPGDYVFGLIAETIGGNSAHEVYEYRMAEDQGLNDFLGKGSQFDKDDLIGIWEMIEPETFMNSGQIAPNGLLLEYRQHQEKQALLLSELTAPQRNPEFSDRNLVFLDTRMLNHVRNFKVDTLGVPDDPLGVEFSVDLVNLYSQDGRAIMLVRNMVSGLQYVFAKASGGAMSGGPAPGGQLEPAFGGQAPPQPGSPAVQQPGGLPGQQLPPASVPEPTLDGVWQRDDGTILIIQGQQFQLNQFGMAVDAGVFAIQGNIVTTQSAYTGVMEQYQLILQGDYLQFQDGWGNVYQYRRIQ